MSRTRIVDLNSNQKLPPIDGPRLAPFKHRDRPIEILGLLSSPPSDHSTSGGHAHVFKALINGSTYALKVFKFYDVVQGKNDIFPTLNDGVDDFDFAFQLDPFFAECRAYGKIKQLERERAKRLKRPQLAVKCHGFLGLPAAKYERLFDQRFGITDWNRLDSEKAEPLRKRQPFRALVKELVETHVALKDGRKMLYDLIALRSNGVYPRDIHERNYLNGLLVDFSCAWTEPMWFSSILSRDEIEEQCDELVDWDDMIERTGLKTRMRAVKDEWSISSVDETQGRYNLRTR